MFTLHDTYLYYLTYPVNFAGGFDSHLEDPIANQTRNLTGKGSRIKQRNTVTLLKLATKK